MTQSGQGEEPSPRQAREGIVLPSDGGEPLLPGMTSGPVAPGGTDGPPAGGYPASAPPGGQTWGNPWGPDQQAASPPPGQEWPSANDGQWQQPAASAWDTGGQGQGGPQHGQYGGQPQHGHQQHGGQPQGVQGPGPLPPEGAPSQSGHPGAHGGHDTYGQGGGYATDGYGQAAGGAAAYGGHTAGGPLPPQHGAGYGAPGGGYGYPPAHAAPPPPAPGADEGATQVIPPVPAGGADEGATQYIPPVAPGALPPEMPAAHDAESTRNLGIAQQPAGPGPLPQPGSPDAEPTQFIAPVTDQGPQPYGAAQGDAGRQPPAEFDNLFRNDDGAAGATQQMPRMDYGRPARADRTPPGPPAPPASGHGGGRGGRGGGGNGGPRWPLIAAVGVGLAVVGVGAGALLGSGSKDDDGGDTNQPVSATAPASTEGSPSPSVDPAREQAVELDKLLAHSGDSRSSVINAVEDVKACRDLGEAASDLREAAKQRKQLVTDLSQLSVDKLPQHEALSEALRKAWKASAAADDHYARWADQTQGKKGCKKGQARVTEQTAAGNRESGTATEQKKKASELWNAIAREYGLTERAPTQL
ncbi:hypothetical protein [Streptomyces albogriseolus]|uniref:hypothetical protein n=1 Tax=Streptomyces albogriseolus TaxID=1887 RepID=UPI0036FF9505